MGSVIWTLFVMACVLGFLAGLTKRVDSSRERKLKGAVDALDKDLRLHVQSKGILAVYLGLSGLLFAVWAILIILRELVGWVFG